MFSTRVDEEITLRLAEERDAEPLMKLIEADRPRLREWLNWVDDANAETNREHIRGTRSQFAEGQALLLVILYWGHSAGLVGFNTIQRPPGKADIGYWLGREYEGKGIMTRACRALVDYGFRELGLHRIEIGAASANMRSRAVPERLGFTQEGVLREDEWLYDHYVDRVIYGMLAHEWPQSDVDGE